MAALDFGMALARGMLPKATKAQKDLINLAGGRNVFKSEDWWNEQVDKQISQGYREATKGKEFLMPSGEYQQEAGKSTTYYRRSIFGTYIPTGMAGRVFNVAGIPQGNVFASTRSIAPEGAVFTIKPGSNQKQYTTREADIFKANAQREDFTAGELSDIESGAKAGASRAKRQTEQAKSAQRRLRKGTGGLLAKAATPEDTGLPSLGQGGLGLTTSILGSETKL